MIHYHGTPISPLSAAAEVLTARHAMVSFARPEQLEVALAVCQSVVLDNGAFSAWRKGKTFHWPDYYNWVKLIKNHPNFDWAIIPDVIEGSEEENDELVNAWPDSLKHVGVPVYHMHESIDRIIHLAENWPRVCLGSSGEFANVGSVSWHKRMGEILSAICDTEGQPICKLHGLRMLSPAIFSRYPFSSADSTNISQNIGMDKSWQNGYSIKDRAWRAVTMARRIEAVNSAESFQRKRSVEPEHWGE